MTDFNTTPCCGKGFIPIPTKSKSVIICRGCHYSWTIEELQEAELLETQARL